MKILATITTFLILLCSATSYSQEVDGTGTFILQFKSKSTRLKKFARSQLDSVAIQVKSDTSKWIVISVFYGVTAKAVEPGHGIEW